MKPSQYGEITPLFTDVGANQIFALKFMETIRKYECSLKGMTRKYLGHRFKLSAQ